MTASRDFGAAPGEYGWPRLPTSGLGARIRSLGRGVLLASLLAAIVPFGAVERGHFLVALLLACTALLLGLLGGPRSDGASRFLRSATVVGAAIGVYVLAQTIPLPNHPLGHSVWALVDQPGRISVDPIASRQALLTLLAPFVVFAAALCLYDGDEPAMRLWRALAIIGALVALFGIAQHVMAPRTLLFGEKRHYVGSLTATFVNRNTTATFLGISLLLLAGWAIRNYLAIDPRKFPARMLQPNFRKPDSYTELTFVLVAMLVVFAALAATLSRAGIAATMVAAIPLTAWFVLRYVLSGHSALVRAIGTVAAVALTLAAFGMLTEGAGQRLEVRGLEDARWCVYAGTLRAIGDHPLVGTGFGTFQSIHPLYRDPACLPGQVWDRAHSVYLEGMLGLGLAFFPLLLACLWPLARAFLSCVRTRRRYRFAGAVGLALLGLVLLHSAVDFSLQIPGVSFYFAAALAAAALLAGGRKPRRR